MFEGEVVQTGTPQELLNAGAHLCGLFYRLAGDESFCLVNFTQDGLYLGGQELALADEVFEKLRRQVGRWVA
ncbi:MAG: hypothetical protein R2865_11260 [Deinococcales bacterium]